MLDKILYDILISFILMIFLKNAFNFMFFILKKIPNLGVGYIIFNRMLLWWVELWLRLKMSTHMNPWKL